MKSMTDAINAIDSYIHKELCYPRERYSFLVTDKQSRIYMQLTDRRVYCDQDISLARLIDARNFIVYGKARKVN